MKLNPIYAIFLFVALSGCNQDGGSQNPASDPVAALDSEEQQIGYAMGVNLALQIRGDGLDVDIDSFVAGVEDGWKDEVRLSDEEMTAALTAFQTQETERRRIVAEEQQNAAREAGEKNIAEATTFLAENGQREGVSTTDSGLQYEVLSAAEGQSPAETDTVSVHYRGTLLDGTEFDSSYARGEPATFPLNRVIAGWTEGVQLMQVGSK